MYVHLKDFWKEVSTTNMEFMSPPPQKKLFVPKVCSHPILKVQHLNIAMLQGLPSCPYFSIQGATALGSDVWHVKFSQSKSFGVMNE